MKSLAALSLIIFLAVAGGVFLWTGPAAGAYPGSDRFI